jgi:acyl-CoA synthetase (AMP-forming)/AMP-acid ligase II
MNTTMLLEMLADAHSERVAIGSRAGGITYGQLLATARRGAAGIRARGLGRVAYLGLNGPLLPATLFAAGAAGAAFAPLNYRLTNEQLQRALAALAPVCVVVAPDAQGRVSAADGVQVLGMDELFAEESAQPSSVAPDAVAVLLLTSGTSGAPKVAMLRHEHLVPYVISTVEFAAADPREAILVSVPPYHIAGISSVLTSVYGGRRMVQLPAFSPAAWVDVAAAEQVTHAMVVPTMLGRILDELERRGGTLPALRHLSYGGGRMPLPVIERAIRLLPHVDFVNAYGLTETSSTIALLGPQEHRIAISSGDPAVRARLGSVGRPLPSVELEIRDADGVPLPAGVAGEIWVRGEQVSGEYVTHRATGPDGWYPTRDRGFLDGDGFLFLEGRADDVIVRGGENISPGEIEDVLLEHPAVAEAAVLGVPDPEWGERVEAVVVPEGPAPDETDLQEWVRVRLRSTRVPARVHVRHVLPATDTGKLLRRVLRDELTGSGAGEARS